MDSFKNKKVLIFGLGLNDGGLGMTEYFLKNGAKVTITDGKSEEQLQPTLKKLKKYREQIIFHLGEHKEEDFLENDIIIRNPAIKPDNKYLKIAKEAGKQIEMEMSLFHKLAPCPIIGITGTRGKSTTTALIYEILKRQYGEKIILGGNIGKSAIRELEKLNEKNLAVLELSSFQLDTMGGNQLSSDIAVVTNVFQDHQDWHPTMEHYIEAKKNIYRYQDPGDYLIINIDNEITQKFCNDCRSKVITFSLKNSNATYFLTEDLKVLYNGRKIFSLQEIKLKGLHNRYNILAAIAATKTYGVENEDIINTLQQFEGVHGRQEYVRPINGIDFYNDTTATSVEAVLAMFETFGEYKGKIIMIAGGVDKGLDYSLLEKQMRDSLKALVLLEGSASEKIAIQMEGFGNVYGQFSDFKEAIEKAYQLGNPGDMVILCPGASSFNMFANEFDRGRQFVDYVNSLR
jgi:UDP-N-acetylmuramoylalanine--D-glutamate ligase